MKKDNAAPDEIDRLVELSRQSEPPPGAAFKNTLEELRRNHPTRAAGSQAGRGSGWSKLALAGLGAAAVLALAFVALSALWSAGKPTQANPLAASVPTPTVMVGTSTGSPSLTQNVIANVQATTTASVSPTSAAATTEGSNKIMPNEPTPPGQNPAPTTASSGPTVSQVQGNNPNNRPGSDPNGATPSGSQVLPLPTPVVIRPTNPANNQPVIKYGRVIVYDVAAGQLSIAGVGGAAVVKIGPTTVITNRGAAAKLSDISEGVTLNATGRYNAQGQLEATSIELNPAKVPSPIPPPGYPDEK